MAKIGIITFLHNDNFGSSLQAYALQRVLREMGHACEHVDYRPDGKEKLRNLLSSGNSWKLVAEGIRKRKVRSGRSGAAEKSRAIPDFYARRMKLSPPCRNSAALKRQSAAYETLLAGSDQIWNPVWMNPAYFLCFASGAQRKLAYAASLGISRMPPERKVRKIRAWTAGFEAVSIREEEGAALLREMTGVTADVMPDPVCLLTREAWEELASPPPSDEPYLLCYFIGANPDYWKKAREEAGRRGLKVLVLPVTAESWNQGYETLDGAGPEEFLGALLGAAAVCTDSFHCLAFSALLGREYILCRRYREEDPESKNSRIDSFLRQWKAEGPDRLREKGLAWLREKTGAPEQEAPGLRT